jgi:excisionase family DNA binding protein
MNINTKPLKAPTYLSVPEAARLCGVTRNTLYVWVRKGKLTAYQTPGRTNLIRPCDLVTFMEGAGLFVPDELREMALRDDAEMDVRRLANQDKPGVLVVDDEPATRSLMIKALQKDYAVQEAETGYQALHALIKDEQIVIVLLDLRMPGQHGTETLNEIQSLRPDVHVVVITGYAADLTERLEQPDLVPHVLEKPVSIHSLRAKLASLPYRAA